MTAASYEIQAARVAVARCKARLEFLEDRPERANHYAIEHARQNLQTALEQLAAAQWTAKIDRE